jgi:hypothetical protein
MIIYLLSSFPHFSRFNRRPDLCARMSFLHETICTEKEFSIIGDELFFVDFSSFHDAV